MSVPNVESYEDAAALGREQLQIVLDSGRPEQRVWAIWALALRGGDPGAITAGRTLEAGARRTLAVILAGNGEVAALVELATRDPELVVRETAMQLLTRLAAGGAVDRATGVSGSGRNLVEESLAKDPAIRIAALGAIGRGAPQFLISIAHRLLRDPDDEIAGEAFEALIRLETREGRDAARVWLLQRPDPASYVGRWLRAGDVHGLAEAASGAPMATRGRVLEQLRSPPWEAVSRLIGNDLELLRGILWRNDIAIPATVLANAIRRRPRDGFTRRLAEQLALAGDGGRLLEDLRTAISAGGLPDLRTLWDRVRRYADAIEVPDRHTVLDDLVAAHPVEQLLGLEHAVARWVVEREAPPELLPLIPELRAYLEPLRESLQLAGHDQPPPGYRPQIAHGGAAGMHDPYTAYRDLVALIAALDRIMARI